MCNTGCIIPLYPRACPVQLSDLTLPENAVAQCVASPRGFLHLKRFSGRGIGSLHTVPLGVYLVLYAIPMGSVPLGSGLAWKAEPRTGEGTGGIVWDTAMWYGVAPLPHWVCRLNDAITLILTPTCI